MTRKKPLITHEMTNGERIRQAREIRGLTQEQLASAVGVDQSFISWIELGAREPSPEVIRAIALFTGFPVSFFRQPSGPEFPLGSLLYRKRSSLPSQDRNMLRQTARLAFEIFEAMGQSFKPREIRLPRLSGETALAAARVTRAQLGLSPDTPVTHLLAKAEQNGVLVLGLPYEIEEHDAFSLWADTEPRKPTLLLTGGKPGDRQRFSVAHELGHLVLHAFANKPIAQLEREAHDFASELLMPEEAMRREIRPPVTLTKLAELKGRWGVSLAALVMRARDLELINEAQKKYLFRQLVAKGWRRREPISIPNEKPRMLAKMAEMLFGVPPDVKRLASLVHAPETIVRDILRMHAAQREVARAPGQATGDFKNGVDSGSAGSLAKPVLEFRSDKKRSNT